MSEENTLNFPDLLCLEDYSGDFSSYFQAVYNVFETDFIKSYPRYNNCKVAVRKYPEVEGLHRTFYHITHEGEDENDRKPDLRRMERIRFPKFIIDNNQHDEILIWKNRRGKDKRVLMLNDNQNYIVILTERKNFYLFITAYYIEQNHRKRKLIKEHEAYKNTKTA